MKLYIGTELINARPMNRADYNTLRGWNLPPDEDGADDGYLVEYHDGGNPNVEGYAGYVSWTTKVQFENVYRPVDSLNFGLAVEALKKGMRVTRKGWNGKDMYLFLLNGSQFVVSDMKTVQGYVVPWLASQTDILSDDWQIL